MKMEPDDSDLSEAFRNLRGDDGRRAPGFRVPVDSRSPWRPRFGILATGLVAAAAGFGLLVLEIALHEEVSPQPVVAEAIPFDALSDAISREVFLASAGEWESPTRFLLNPESLTRTESEK